MRYFDVQFIRAVHAPDLVGPIAQRKFANKVFQKLSKDIPPEPPQGARGWLNHFEGQMKLQIFVTDIEPGRVYRKTDGREEITDDLYWFEENGVRNFESCAEEFKIEIVIGGRLVWCNNPVSKIVPEPLDPNVDPHSEIQDFGKTTRCPMCLSGLHDQMTRFHERCGLYSIRHLHVTCRVCGFTWETKTAELLQVK